MCYSPFLCWIIWGDFRLAIRKESKKSHLEDTRVTLAKKDSCDSFFLPVLFLEGNFKFQHRWTWRVLAAGLVASQWVKSRNVITTIGFPKWHLWKKVEFKLHLIYWKFFLYKNWILFSLVLIWDSISLYKTLLVKNVTSTHSKPSLF